jgi:transposase InsO family protein
MIFPVLYAMAKRCALKVAVIGWAMGHRLTVDLAEQALTIALANRNPQAGPLHHSERGSQGGFKWSLQHILCWPIGASGQAPLQAFSNSAFYEAWH